MPGAKGCHGAGSDSHPRHGPPCKALDLWTTGSIRTEGPVCVVTGAGVGVFCPVCVVTGARVGVFCPVCVCGHRRGWVSSVRCVRLGIGRSRVPLPLNTLSRNIQFQHVSEDEGGPGGQWMA